MPTAEESELLGLAPGDPVLSVLVVACDVTGQAPQVVDVVMLADCQELEDTQRIN